MKSFKRYLEEKQSFHDDLYLILLGNIKLDPTSSCKIWERCGKRDSFRHLTDKEGALYLINNKNKNVTISALKISNFSEPIETNASIIVNLDANYNTWFPRDAYTYIGSGFKRWVSLNKSFSGMILTPPFIEEYLKEFYKLIKKNKKFNDAYFQAMGTSDESEFIKILSGNKSLSNVDTTELLTLVKELQYDRKDFNSDKFEDDVIKLQHKILDKYSDVIQERLTNFWKRLHNVESGTRKRMRGGDDFDEAVVDNISVNHVYLKPNPGNGLLHMVETINDILEGGRGEYSQGEFESQIEDWLNDAISTEWSRTRFMLTNDIIDFANKSNGIPFTFVDRNGSLVDIKSSLKKHKNGWDYILKKLNWKLKGIFFRKA
jgi:hypothetical protein